MATPEFQLSTQSLTLTQGQLQTVSFGVAKDKDGVAVDIDTGFEAALQIIPVTAQATDAMGLQALLSDSDFTLGGDGSVIAEFPASVAYWSGTYKYALFLSNDSFSTKQTIRKGNLTLNAPA